MSIIEQALRKLELSRWNEQQAASEYLTPTPVVAPGGRRWPGPLWLAAAGLAAVGAAAAAVWIGWPDLAGGGRWVAAPAASADTPARAVALERPPPAASPSPAAALAPSPSPAAATAVSAQGAVAESTQKIPSAALDWNAAPWIREGAQAMAKNDVAGAVRVWSAGLAQLPASAPLVVLPPSASRASALALYASLAGRYPVVVLEQGPSGEQQWRVMVVPERQEAGELVRALRAALQRKTLAATTALAWRTALAGSPEPSLPQAAGPAAAPGTVSAGLNDAALAVANTGKAKEKAGSSAAAGTAAEELDPARSVQGSAVSSADAVLRRFTSVERLVAKGQFEAALQALAHVEADVGETWQTRYLQGAAAKGLGRWDEAIAALTRAHQLNALSVKVLLERAICRQELGNHAGALDDLSLARTLNPDMPEIVLNTGYSLEALGRRSDAWREYKAYLDMTAHRSEYATVRAWVAKRLAR